ncbi:MAG: MFS transporter, partial [Desulfobacterales bacterium]|nr:MFS transporter [Desulfobacterales bacterium]
MSPESSGETPKLKPAFFYGWVMIAVGFINLSIAFGVWYSFSVFILSLIKEFGWTRAAASSIFSVFIFSQALMNMLAGHLQDRFGPRVVIPVGAVLLSISLVLTSQSQVLWHFSLTYGVFAGAGVSLLGFASHAAFIPKWFERKRGLAVGIAMSGIGFGMLILIPLVEKFISLFGWRMTYISLAALVLFLIVPLNLIFSRRSPESIGLMPDGDDSEEAQNANHSRVVKVINESWAQESWTLKKAIRTKRFWFLSFAFYFLAFSYQGTLLHSVSAMVDFGLKRENAAFFFGILGIMGSVGKIVLGYLSDVYGRERINTLGAILAVFGILSLIN